jgi:hypothetical protein
MEQGSRYSCNGLPRGLKMLRSSRGRVELLERTVCGPKTIVIAVIISVAAAVLVGCGKGGSGKPTAHLSGAITIDGQPVPDDAWVTINFRSVSTGQATSAQITDSNYDCPDAPLGNVDVAIQILQRTGKMVSEGGRSWPETRSLIADNYARGIKLEVSGDNSDQDFALTSK